MTSHRFWPFESRYAWWATALLLPTTLAVAAGLQSAGVLPGHEMTWWVLLGAVLIGLLPVLSLVLGGVSAFKAAGVEVSFAAVQQAVYAADEATVRSTLSDNLGAPPGVVLDSAGDTIIQALRAAVTNDVVVVNLGEGHEWWDTRLLLLTAGATRLGHPRAIAFTATRGVNPGQYLGWAAPADLLRAQLSRDRRWREAYRLAHRDTLLVALADETSHLPWPTPDPTTPDPVSPFVSMPTNSQGADDPYLPERFLRDRLRQLEFSPHEPERLEITITRLEDLFAPVLHQDSMDTQGDEAQWFDGILNDTAPYLAVIAQGQLAALVPRGLAINAALRSLLRARAQLPPDRAARRVPATTSS